MAELLEDVGTAGVKQPATLYHGRRGQCDGIVAHALLDQAANVHFQGDFTIVVDAGSTALTLGGAAIGGFSTGNNDAIRLLLATGNNDNIVFLLRVGLVSSTTTFTGVGKANYKRRAFVVDNTAKTLRLWQDGAYHATTGTFTTDTTLLNLDYGLGIGAQNAAGTISQYLDGFVGSVQIYPSALNQTQLEAIDASGGAPVAGAECWLSMCEAANGVAVAKYYDHSGTATRYDADNNGIQGVVAQKGGLQVARLGHTERQTGDIPGETGTDPVLIVAKPDDTTDFTGLAVDRPYTTAIGSTNPNNEGFCGDFEWPQADGGAWTYMGWIKRVVNTSGASGIFGIATVDTPGVWMQIAFAGAMSLRYRSPDVNVDSTIQIPRDDKWYCIGYRKGASNDGEFFYRAADGGSWTVEAVADSASMGGPITIMDASRREGGVPAAPADVPMGERQYDLSRISDADRQAYYDATKGKYGG